MRWDVGVGEKDEVATNGSQDSPCLGTKSILTSEREGKQGTLREGKDQDIGHPGHAPPHTHTQTGTYTHTDTHTHTHACTHTHIHTQTYTHRHTHTHTMLAHP